MSTIIPVAKQSPRIQDGVIKWYFGDAFSINWTISLTEDDQPLAFQPGDSLTWNFFSDDKTLIHSFIFNYEDIHSDTVILSFTEEISKKFAVGNYTYCVKFSSHDGRLVTLNANNKVKVEQCH